ncbi:MAG TPA: hypothetical protein VJH68_04080 [Candidatus Nanoarchaeia archaeon]|nr:hypothetical protein [Candidatus Nanoarchaeia archaeon]
MGFFSKLKKKKDLDFDTLADKEFNDSLDPLAVDDSQPFSQDALYPQNEPLNVRQAPVPQFSPQQFQLNSENKDLELINSKLDTLKALLYSIDRRLEALERQSGAEQKNRLW